MPCCGQVSASQYQEKTHSQATTRSSRKGAMAARKASGLAGRFFAEVGYWLGKE
jgi:hypothetical protein